MTANHHHLSCISCDSKDTETLRFSKKDDTITTLKENHSWIKDMD